VPDVKADTTGATDVVLMGTNAGLFCSTDGGQTYAAVPTLTGVVWSLARTSAGWIAARTVGLNGSLLVSLDKGATWAPIPNSGSGFSGAARTTLAVAQPGDSVVYAFRDDRKHRAARPVSID
jgi:photosystem II stability/assembly factor-like uncharacterized protein